MSRPTKRHKEKKPAMTNTPARVQLADSIYDEVALIDEWRRGLADAFRGWCDLSHAVYRVISSYRRRLRAAAACKRGGYQRAAHLEGL